MKRFWLVLLSLGLIAAFSTSAMAVDVKFSGEFYGAGMYLDKTTLNKVPYTYGPPPGTTVGANQSTAFYFQRLRLRTDFVISPGLTLTTRFDAMERAWGAGRSTPGTAADAQSQGTTAENENIAFDMAYVSYASPIGVFGVGYQQESTWGTVFGNSNSTVGKITYTLPIKNFVFLVQLVKHAELSRTAKFASPYTDADYDALYLMAIYNFKYGTVGIANFALYNHTTRGAGFKTNIPLYLAPYASLKFGPVALQGEFWYQRGKRHFEIPTGLDDVDVIGMAGWLDVVADFGVAYVGGTFAYAAGDDPGTRKIENGSGVTGGNDWNPCLIMWNYDRAYWAGGLTGYNPTDVNGTAFANGFFYQLRGGVRPIAKLDLMASVSYAHAERVALAFDQARDYGWEIDVTGTYKITNNLSYMLGFGYLFTGKFFKGPAANPLELHNDYIVMNKLTLTF